MYLLFHSVQKSDISLWLGTCLTKSLDMHVSDSIQKKSSETCLIVSIYSVTTRLSVRGKLSIIKCMCCAPQTKLILWQGWSVFWYLFCLQLSGLYHYVGRLPKSHSTRFIGFLFCFLAIDHDWYCVWKASRLYRLRSRKIIDLVASIYIFVFFFVCLCSPDWPIWPLTQAKWLCLTLDSNFESDFNTGMIRNN